MWMQKSLVLYLIAFFTTLEFASLTLERSVRLLQPDYIPHLRPLVIFLINYISSRLCRWLLPKRTPKTRRKLWACWQMPWRSLDLQGKFYQYSACGHCCQLPSFWVRDWITALLTFLLSILLSLQNKRESFHQSCQDCFGSHQSSEFYQSRRCQFLD